ncbi:MAG: DUF427 domain-containing protein [Actinomycetia bacterium]|nr:DUF427 domain-containing protein [Actinomycetes bacterium]
MTRLPRGVVPVAPGPGQESVWAYPRPPRVESSSRHVVVELDGLVIVDTVRALRVLETSHPPSWYLPMADVRPGVLVPVGGTSTCEFKGTARYFDVVAGGRREPRAAWTYPDPMPGFEALRDYVALYPGRMDRCTVDGVDVAAQEGGFYGGWVTPDVVGPFKGGPGTWGW